jgi:hypothetical protein
VGKGVGLELGTRVRVTTVMESIEVILVIVLITLTSNELWFKVDINVEEVVEEDEDDDDDDTTLTTMETDH